MKCKDDQCSNEVTGKQVYCSDACRKRTSRTSKSDNNSDITIYGSDAPPNPDNLKGVTFDEPYENRPPCTGKQLSSPCHACKEFKTCDYLHNMKPALPGDTDYEGVCQDRQGVLQPVE